MIYPSTTGKLWTAPELLRSTSTPTIESIQKGDVYSFAIICQEIIYRRGVFWIENKKFNPFGTIICISVSSILTFIYEDSIIILEIYDNVRRGLKPSYRPTLTDQFDEEPCSDELLNLVRKCWSEDPYERPDFQSLKSPIKIINK